MYATETPAGEAAVAVHRGPYDSMNEAYDAIEEWMAAHRRESAGHLWEIDGDPTPDPADTQREVLRGHKRSGWHHKHEVNRMDDADVAARNVARELSKLRWSPSPVVRRAAEIVVQRWDELDPEYQAQARAKAAS